MHEMTSCAKLLNSSSFLSLWPLWPSGFISLIEKRPVLHSRLQSPECSLQRGPLRFETTFSQQRVLEVGVRLENCIGK